VVTRLTALPETKAFIRMDGMLSLLGSALGDRRAVEHVGVHLPIVRLELGAGREVRTSLNYIGVRPACDMTKTVTIVPHEADDAGGYS
jgi:hypothetical protein